jgi:hypothetical protein
VNRNPSIGEKQLETISLSYGITEGLCERTLGKVFVTRSLCPREEVIDDRLAALLAQGKVLGRAHDPTLGRVVLDTEETPELDDGEIRGVTRCRSRFEELAPEVALMGSSP